MKIIRLFFPLVSSMLMLPGSAQNAATPVNPTGAAVEWFTRAAPDGSVAPNAYQAQVTLTFGVPNVTVTSWGAPVRDGNNVNITIAAVQSATASGGNAGVVTTTTATKLFDLGVLPIGEYSLRIFSGNLLVRSVPFASAAYPPAIPVTAAVTVNAANPDNVTATVTLQFTQVVQLRPPGPVRMDSIGRYLLEAVADRVPQTIALNVLPPPFTLTYALGAVPAGNRVAVFRLNGKTLVEKPFTVSTQPPPPPPPPGMDVAVTFTKSVTTTGIAIRARVEFKDAAWVLTNQGTAVRTENTFNVQATAAATAVLPANTPRVFEPVYNLGLLPAGAYTLNYFINNQKKGAFEFTVEAVPPPPPPPAPVTLESFAVRADGTIQVADVALTIGSPATQITNWGAAVKDGALFIANVTTATSSDPVIQVIRTERHSYPLGTLAAGQYTFVMKVDGREIGRRGFAVNEPPPPPQPRFVYLKPMNTPAGYQVEAAILLPAGTVVTDWGSMRRVENRFSATVGFGPGTTPAGDANADPANSAGLAGTIVKHLYDLGNLERGVYQVALLRADNTVLGTVQFSVAGTVPPPPQEDVALQRIEVFNDASSVRSLLVVNIANPGSTVLDWGTPVISGNTVSYAIKVGPRPTPVPAGAGANGDPGILPPIIEGPHQEMHTYDLGSLSAGTYRFIVSANAVEIGRREITIGAPPPPPPPPPPPVPNVAYVKFGATAAGRTAEVGILLPAPNLEVTDWGTVATDGNKLRVCVTVAESNPPPPPVDPPVDPPVVDQPVDPNDPGVVALNGLAAASEAGSSPVRLATHVYSLGALAPGEYSFTVCIGGRDVVTRRFVVEGSAAGVTGTLLPSNIEAVKTGPHVIHLQFKSGAGMETAAGAKVKVSGPNGFSAEAVFKSEGILSADPVGMILGADFEVSTADGSWDAADSGAYPVFVDLASVTDKAGNPLRNGNVGSFTVRIWPTPPPTHLPAVVSVSQAEGKWLARATITTASTQRPWKVKATKPVLAAGPVLNLAAELEPGQAGTDPAQIVLTFDLGVLPPGRYLAVFKSNAGHCGSAPFAVAGEEPPTPMAGWQQIAFENGDLANPGIVADNADPDGDGQWNLAEYCLGTDPIRPDAPQFQPSIERDAAGQPHLVILFRRISNAADVRTIVEVSRDLKSWQAAGDDVEVVIRSQDVDGTEQVCACQKAVLGQPGSWPFMRVRLEKVDAPPAAQ